jgi:ABC-2 type transport system ATP-binding protein
MPNAVEVYGLRKSFGTTEVLRGVDVTVHRGEIFALLGPNGAGKTTLLNILSTLVRPDAGTAAVDGIDVVRRPDDVKERISLTGQSAAVDEVLTGQENLRMMGRLSGLPKSDASQRASELLRRFGLQDAGGKQVRTYSGGMRRRLDLAIGLLRTPSVVFLDEPTTGLDTRSRQELWTAITELAATGTTVVLTTQYLEEADRLADRIAVLTDGRIVAEGTPSELKAAVGGDLVALHDASDAVVRELPTDGTVEGLTAVLASLAGASAYRVTLRRPTLDDVFLSLTTDTSSAHTPAPTGKD